jgi:hypothetical protein
MPAGRPTLFRQEYIELVEKFCLLGARDADLARAFDVAESTIDNWKVAHPEFLAALKAGREIADANVASSLYRLAIGDAERAPNVNAQIFWLKNRRPDLWRDVQGREHAIDVKPTQLSTEERVALVRKKMAEIYAQVVAESEDAANADP